MHVIPFVRFVWFQVVILKKKSFFLRVHILCLYIDVHRNGRMNREGRKFDITLDFHTNHNCVLGETYTLNQYNGLANDFVRLFCFFLIYHCSVQSESLLTMLQIASNHHSIQVHSPRLIVMIRILNFKMAIEKIPLTSARWPHLYNLNRKKNKWSDSVRGR